MAWTLIATLNYQAMVIMSVELPQNKKIWLINTQINYSFYFNKIKQTDNEQNQITQG